MAAVPWVSVLRMLPWLGFCGRKKSRKPFELTIAMRNIFREVLELFAAPGPRAPERVGRGKPLPWEEGFWIEGFWIVFFDLDALLHILTGYGLADYFSSALTIIGII